MALKVFEWVRTSPQITHAFGKTSSCQKRPVFETTHFLRGSGSGLLDTARGAYHVATYQMLGIDPSSALLPSLVMCQLLDDLVAFFEEHRRCGKLDGGIDYRCVWMSCECGGRIVQRIEGPHHDRQNDDLTGRDR